MEPIDAAVARTIAESALAGERILAIARLVFCSLVIARSLYVFDGIATYRLQRALIAYPAQALAVGFSIAVLRGLGRRRTDLILHISVAIDVVVGFLVLLPNAIWPGPHYDGAPFMIDTSVILILIVAAGVRHSATVVALCGGLAGLALAGLAFADHTYAHVATVTLSIGYSMYGVLLAAVAALSLVIAIRTRRLVERTARAAVVANKAEQGLRAVLHDHHDLRTVITSAQINADLLSRGLARGASVRDTTVEQLREDLGELRTQLDQVKARALEELVAIETAVAVALDTAVDDVASALAQRFPDVRIEKSSALSHSVMVAGGVATLRRIIANLVVNACEGDGARGARRVDVSAGDAPAGRVSFEIADDGPGLPPALLERCPGEGASTKAEGTGLGMQLVEGLVRASGGTVSWRAREGGGTRVIVELAAAEPVK